MPRSQFFFLFTRFLDGLTLRGVFYSRQVFSKRKVRYYQMVTRTLSSETIG
jgi:hypothetical protein